MADCIYLRKSRVDFEAESHSGGDTLARHEQALLRHAASLGRTITHIYREVVSGETIAARPEMQRLLKDVERGVWDAVHVMEVERLARGDTLDQGIVSQAFLYSKTLIITPKKTYNPENEFDEEYFEFGLFMSRREYKTINRRQQAGRLASLREGKWVANKAPYGYERVKLQGQKGWTLQPKEPEAGVVRDMFRWALQGYTNASGVSKQLGVSLIVRRLNELGTPSPTGIDWVPSTVRDILKNETYAGWVRWGRRGTKKELAGGAVRASRPRLGADEYQRFPAIHPPLVDQSTFDAVQGMLITHPSLPGPKDVTLKNPLASLIICGGCGRAMVRRPHQSGRQASLICPYTSCSTMSSDLEAVEHALSLAISQWLIELSLPENNGTQENGEELTALNAALAALEKELSAVCAQEKRAFELVEQNVYSVDQFLARSKELSERKIILQGQIEANALELRQREQSRALLDELRPRAEHVLASYPVAQTAEEKNKLLRSILDHVKYTKSTGGRYQESNMKLALYPRASTPFSGMF